jgi:hypothetical protein
MVGAFNALRENNEPRLPDGAFAKKTLLDMLSLLSPEEAAKPRELQSLKCVKR